MSSADAETKNIPKEDVGTIEFPFSPDDLYLYNLSDPIINSLKLTYFDHLTNKAKIPIQKELNELEDAQNKLLYDNKTNKKKTNDGTDEETTLSYLNSRSPYIFFKSNLLNSININGDISDEDAEKIDDDNSNRNDNVNQEEIKSFSIYKNFFDQSQLNDPINTLKSFKKQYHSALSSKKTNESYSTLFMIGGGHFVAAIISHNQSSLSSNSSSLNNISKNFRFNLNNYENNSIDNYLQSKIQLINHKTFHRYTTRKKQGGSQLNFDNSSNKNVKSAGSTMRRNNELLLIDDIINLFNDWKSYLKNSKSIYIKFNANNAIYKKIITHLHTILNNNTSKIKNYPFTTYRPSLHEIKLAWIKLSYISIENLPKLNQSHIKKLNLIKNQKEKEKQKTFQKDYNSDDEDDNNLNSDDEEKINEDYALELIKLMKKSKAPAFISYLRSNQIDPSAYRFPSKFTNDYKFTPTLLHYAAQNKLSHMAYILMNNLKIDPTITNINNKTPWDLINKTDLATRNSFQLARFNLGESFCSWESSKVGPPLSKKQIEQVNQKNQEIEKKIQLDEKRELKSVLRKEKGKITEKKPAQSSKILLKTNDLSSLSDEQRRRIMREQRARAAEKRLKMFMDSKK
ncbi:Vms1p ASCRUDRAFT_81321 [Ascoidea rubescens DSM 1968]|uniref:VLRF1 domain-containing protein n=1 Tax=Ascoidea rubescens DSM 1968 TaxID=1344418 RepID=A0A1D2VFS5_9ASCO|nr:hypothetical protein ASCRUDRAFT_81321 [Ascoidea rubescens DSM 1968]ODV60327.1 hypothetical protein ASCRUDRAFT_81321 [Ascoidea rubescens DSM 1968]